MRIAIVTTHPIQYQVPWFRGLARSPGVELKVFYALLPTPSQQGMGFGISFTWDIGLLDGYAWELLPSSRPAATLQGFFGNSTPSVFNALRQHRPDVLILPGWHSFPLIQAIVTAKALSIPTIVRGESNAMRPRPWYIRAVHKLILRQFAGFLAIGQSNKTFYLNANVPEERIWSAPYFVDDEVFRGSGPDRSLARERWKIDRRAFCFLYVGKLEPKKRLLDLLSAFRILVQKQMGTSHLLVVGSGELLGEIEAFALQHELPVTFSGFLNRTEIRQAFASSDCLVLPSDYGETWGLVVNEAMMNGLPTVVSDRVGCGPDLVIEDKTGFRFPFGDVDALADVMAKFLVEPQLAVLLGKSARDLVKNYSCERAVQGTVEASRAVLHTSLARS